MSPPAKIPEDIGLSCDNNQNLILFKEIKIYIFIKKFRKNDIPAKPNRIRYNYLDKKMHQ